SAADFVRALDAAAAPTPVKSSRAALTSAIVGGAALIAVGAWLTVNAIRKPASHVTLADRTQVTFTGKVRNPSISRDGTQLAYPVTNCQPSGCTYAIDVQDVGGTTTRRLFDGATALYDIEWSSDRRNIVFEGSINGAFGEYVLSTLGGVPRRITPVAA